MKQFLDKYGVAVVTILVLLTAASWYVFGRGPKGPPGKAYFIDEDNNVESVQDGSLVPPLTGAKGNPSVVKEYKYRVAGSSAIKVGYYFKFTPEMKAKMEEAQAHPEKGTDLTPTNGMLVRKPDAGPNGWVPATSGEGKKIIEGDPNEGPRETIYP